jgi:precorrin-6B methylase 2
MIVDDIDFGAMYREHIERVCPTPKPPEDWDKRAEDLARLCASPGNRYAAEFLQRMQVRADDTVLDVGCGPGTIALPVARQCSRVYGLDYSQRMLDVMRHQAEEQRLDNVEYIRHSWDDNWDDVPQCDIAVASRSTMVNDLEDALRKLNAKAKRYVYSTHAVDRHFVAADIMDCIGRSAVGFPGYIYTINLLYRMGYQPRVDFLTIPTCRKSQPGFDAFVESIRWSIGELSADEVGRLRHYYDNRSPRDVPMAPTQRTWAFICWSTER